MSQRVQSPECVVHGMGHPGEGVPVAYVETKERPSEERQIERTNVRIIINIDIIIPVHEFIVK
jgi:hypothetical protein